MVSTAQSDQLRQAQAGLRAVVERDLSAFFASLDMSNPERARDELLRFVPVLVRTYGESASAFAADWFDDVRAAERVPGRFRAVMVDSPYLDATEGTARRAAGALFTDTPNLALAALLPSVGKYVLAAGRQTIVTSTARDPRASGWQRVIRAGACRFCRMLAGRGDVYKESTAHFASHGDCNCAAAPSWDRDAPEVDVALYEVSKRTSSMTPEQHEDHAARVREYLAGMDD